VSRTTSADQALKSMGIGGGGGQHGGARPGSPKNGNKNNKKTWWEAKKKADSNGGTSEVPVAAAQPSSGGGGQNAQSSRQRWGPIIRGVLVQEAKMFKITRIINLVDSKQLFMPSKEAKVAMAVEAVSSPNPSNVGCKDAEILTGTTGEIV
jgi:hypothetical protein